ncbi:ATP-binding protein [Streptomyces flavochromogenes]|uniref:ATP-binding protein n=1 Tax=Streptomyces flavochromogenes TaxID=68199 RepID=A0ABW6XZ84_9ACTN
MRSTSLRRLYVSLSKPAGRPPRLPRRLRLARWPASSAPSAPAVGPLVLRAFQPELDARKVEYVATLSFVEDKANVLCSGRPGSARRTSPSPPWPSRPARPATRSQSRLISKLTSYLRPRVLVVDEVGPAPRTSRGEPGLPGDLQAYEKGSIILTSNRSLRE